MSLWIRLCNHTYIHTYMHMANKPCNSARLWLQYDNAGMHRYSVTCIYCEDVTLTACAGHDRQAYVSVRGIPRGTCSPGESMRPVDAG